MNALGALEWKGARDEFLLRLGPVGQLGNAQVIPLEEKEELREEYESRGDDGEGHHGNGRRCRRGIWRSIVIHFDYEDSNYLAGNPQNNIGICSVIGLLWVLPR